MLRFSFEQDKKPTPEEPLAPAAREDSEYPAAEGRDVNEDVILKEMRLHDKERFAILESAERKLNRALAETPETLYEQDQLIVEKRDIPLWRILDLEESLRDLEEFKTQLPKRYELHASRVAERAPSIKRMFEEYRSWAETKAHWSSSVVKSNLLLPLVELRRINPDLFPRDLVNLTDEEFRDTALPIIRSVDDALFRKALLAEYDPQRFSRLFKDKYPPERVARERASWADYDRKYRGISEPSRLKAWEMIERALQAPGQGGAQSRDEI
jgi:hypothetical protein